MTPNKSAKQRGHENAETVWGGGENDDPGSLWVAVWTVIDLLRRLAAYSDRHGWMMGNVLINATRPLVSVASAHAYTITTIAEIAQEIEHLVEEEDVQPL